MLAACGGGQKQAAPPRPKSVEKPAPPPETEADRENKRHAAALAIVPEGSTCLPTALKDDGAPRLELQTVGKEATLCAVDTDKSRLLGDVACWKVGLPDGTLAPADAAPVPGRGFDVKIDDNCARGYCLPKDAKLPESKIAHIALSLDGAKVAVLAGDQVHIFDAASKEHQSAFDIRGDKGVTNDPIAIDFVGDDLFIEGADQGPYSAVWMYKADGTAIGPLTGIGKDDKPLSSFHGSFSILDKNRVALAERGMEIVTVYELDTGKRSKLVRKLGKTSCKGDELDAFWHDGDKVTDKCRDSVMKMSGHLMGATAIAGTKSWVVLLRNDRAGELALLDPKTLAERSAIKLKWCDAAAGDDKKAGDKKADDDKK
jgi:hypothetical protein